MRKTLNYVIMAGFQSPITIAQAIEHIHRNEYLLPAFQRDFVWSAEQIEKLFDSLMKGYPISSMLFWKVKGGTKTDFRFYKFLSAFIQYHRICNDPIPTDNINDFYAVLDGQQRLTSLYIGLCGSYAYKDYRKRWDYSEYNFPTRHLYFNISRKYTQEESDREFIFSFVDKNISKENDLFIDKSNEKWFRVGKILALHQDYNYGIDEFAEDNNIDKESKRLLRLLDNVIHTKLNINFYEEDEQKPDKAVNIFIRINSGGTALSFSDILMSIAIANCKQMDAKTEINNLVEHVRATVGKNSHIGAGAVLAGVIEPASAEPVRIGDNVLVGANAVVIEGVQVGNGSVVAAGAIVTQDVPENVVVAGVPARIIKEIDEKTQQKTALEDALRNL